MAAVHTEVAQAIEALRPAVRSDGGDILLRGVDEATGVVTVELRGACGGCPSSTATLRAGVARILRDRVPGVTAVEPAPHETETPVSL